MSTEGTASQADFRQLVREEWGDADTIAAWRKWHAKMSVQLQATTDALLEAVQARPGLRILDLGCGTGLPALDLARVAGPTGWVTAVDLSPAMIEIAAENARAAGLDNLEFRVADAEDLPFSDESFDAVTSRIGAMYFIDIQRALGEIRRVLRPGGIVALAVWGPPDQGSYVRGMLGPFFERITLPEPPPGAPTPFRFATAGALSSELRQAGFRDVHERTAILPAPWPGTPEEYWQHFYEVAVPLRPVFGSLPPDEFARARSEAIELLRAHYDGHVVQTTVAMVIASGTR
ncbi:MAG: methyltransferase domain-containing protein [Chloroflexi bacterium]|nr:methyltransferase domain-containing protein [Chloroflexota bacterium]